MTKSLKELDKKIIEVETFITDEESKTYIANKGTADNSKKLGDIAANYYRCNGSCSWTCSGTTKEIVNLNIYKGK